MGANIPLFLRTDRRGIPGTPGEGGHKELISDRLGRSPFYDEEGPSQIHLLCTQGGLLSWSLALLATTLRASLCV